MKKSKRLSVRILKIIPLIALITFAVLYINFSDDFTVENILNYTPKNISLAACFIILMYGVKSLTVFFPIIILMLVSGAIFNTFTAIMINIIGTIVCISIPYFIGRFSGSNTTDNIILRNEKLKMLADYQQKNKFFFSYFVRVLGCLPCDIISLYMGIIKIPYFTYISGSILGFLPGIISITIIGENITNPKSLEFILSCVFTVILSASSLVIYTLIKKKHKKGD